jgi:AraC-like DNA-binding protein
VPCPLPSAIHLHLRSYDASRESDRHDFAQLVLPVTGQIELEIDGKLGLVDALQGGVVAPQTWHSQCGRVANQSIIVDMDSTVLEQAMWSRLLDRSFISINPGARKLIEYMAIMAQQASLTPPLVTGWTPLLLDTLALGKTQTRSRLSALVAHVQEAPGLPWSTQSMAHYAGLSVSRLHALFRDELQMSPHAWLLQQRISRACRLLAHSDDNVADIALASGFSDQSALTRAMRDNIDRTPAAYRRQAQRQNQENTSKNQ